MATDTQSGFGRVSRVRGVVFRYLTLAASLVGIVSLAVLLGFVTWDAFDLDTAGAGWWLAYFLAFVVPTAAFFAFLRRRADARATAVALFVRTVGGTILAASFVVLRVIVDLQLWLLLYTVGVVPAIGVYAAARRRESERLAVGAAAWLVVGSLLGFWLKGPIDTFPTDFLVLVWTLAVPAGAITAWQVREETTPRGAVVAGGATVAGTTVFAVAVDLLTAIAATDALVLAIVPGVLVALLVVRTIRRPGHRLGLALPLVVAGGIVLAETLVGAVGATEPTPWLDWNFLTAAPSRFPEDAGLYPAIIGSVLIVSLVAIVSFLFGVGTAVYLEEYAPESGVAGSAARLLRVNISNLAGVPSVVYGLLGLGVFVNLLNYGIGIVLVASATLSLLILPIVIISAQEAIRAVPDSNRRASYGMGATRWQTVRKVVLPQAFPGTLTGTILALGRAIGETAPLIIIGSPTTKFTPPAGLLDRATAMPLQVFGWAFLPDQAFRFGVVAAGVVTLMVVLLAMNSVAIYLRNRYEITS